ncbi:hypothetical protein L7F22_057908 [Adiantum nelumboides]|nr:hypothetical protein [Adiantum nelumboides]
MMLTGCVLVPRPEEDHSDQLSHDWLRHYVDDYTQNTTDGAASAPIFSRFTQSALFPTPPSSSSSPASPASAGPRQRAPSSAADEVKITIGTFNVNGQAPTAATTLGAWLHPEDEPDILVVSLQEADASSLSYVYWTPHVQEAWDGAVRGMLARRAGEYERVAARQLVGILLFVYVRRELLPRLSHVALTSLGVGLGGWAANKGAVAARFEVDGTSLCFVASHLSAFEGGEARERRRWDYGEIVRRLSFTYALDDGDGGGGESDEKGKAHQAAEDPASTKEQVAKKHEGRERKALDLTMTEPDAATLLQAQLQASLDAEAAAVAAADAVSYEEATIFDHDVVFWAGDLNFRLELPIGEIKRLIRKRMFEGALLRFDELRSEMSAKSCFEGFQEQPITFAPTYKFDRGTDEYDTSEKKRKPAWTDRILWRCRSSSSSSSEVRPVSYESAPEVLLSDHKPVSACFIVKIGSE